MYLSVRQPDLLLLVMKYSNVILTGGCVHSVTDIGAEDGVGSNSGLLCSVRDS